MRTKLQAANPVWRAVAGLLLLAAAPVLMADEIQVPVQAGESVEPPAVAEAESAPTQKPIVRETFGSSDIKDW